VAPKGRTEWTEYRLTTWCDSTEKDALGDLGCLSYTYEGKSYKKYVPRFEGYLTDDTLKMTLGWLGAEAFGTYNCGLMVCKKKDGTLCQVWAHELCSEYKAQEDYKSCPAQTIHFCTREIG